MERLTDWLRKLGARLGFQRDWYLVVVAAGVGAVTALGAIGFIWLVHAGEGLARGMHDRTSGFSWWLLILIPMIGALLTGLLVHTFAREAKGHGVPQVIEAIYRRRSIIRPRVAVVKSIASACTIGSGGSAGAEGPIVQIGSAIGSGMAQLLRASKEQTTTLLGCGAAAGIASVFNAPIAGVFFVLEILLRDFSLRTFTPIIVSAVFSAAVTQAILGRNDALFAVSDNLAGYSFTISELPSYFVLGLFCGVISVGFIKVLHDVEHVFERRRIHPIIKPVVGAAMLGLVGVGYMLAIRAHDPAAAGEIPHFFGNGYETIRSLIEPASFGQGDAPAHATGAMEAHARAVPAALWAIMLLVACKALGTALTLGSGGSGGVFAPSLFLGAAAGAAFGVGLEQIGLMPEGGSPAAYALVGMAAVLAGTSHAPLTAIILLFEITRDAYVLLPIMLAAVVATIVAQLMMRDSIYTHALRARGLLLGSTLDTTMLRKLTARDIDAGPHTPVHPNEPITKLLELRDQYRINDFVVTDTEQRFLGVVTGDDLRHVVLAPDAAPYMTVDELLRKDFPVIEPDETLDVAMEKFGKHLVASLPLVEGGSGPNARRVTGLITLARLMACYQKALAERDA